MQAHLITTDDVSALSRGMSVHVDDGKVEVYLTEAENMDVKPALGDALFLDVRDNPGKYELLLEGGTYETGCGEKRLFSGLKVALAYYAYARIVKNGDGNVTRYGFVNKENEYGSHPEYKERLMAYNDAFDVAARYMKECLDYLNENKKSFPTFRRGKVRTNGTNYKVMGE